MTTLAEFRAAMVEAGDEDAVRVCDRALAGDDEALDVLACVLRDEPEEDE